MYQFSRAIYRELAPFVVEDAPPSQRQTNRELVLSECEHAIERLMTDRRYFAAPTRTLFNSVRPYFAMGDLPRVYLAIDRNVDMAIIGKRHAFEGAYHVAYKDGEVVAMTTALASDGGNTIDCSYFVIHVAQLHADNCYLVPTFGVGGTVYKTNEASNISMRLRMSW